MKYVNLGCGSRFHSEWINFDMVARGEGVISHDIANGIPLEDASVDVVYHSHVMEHLRYSDAERFLQECLRVLKPGGVLRVAMPDLEQICRMYLKALEEAESGNPEAAANYEWLLLELLDQTVRERSGGEMLEYLKRRPLVNEDFVLSRIGEEGRELLREVRNEKPAKKRSRSLAKRFRQGALNLFFGRDAAQALQIGRFRLAGEVHQWLYDRYSLSALLQKVGFDSVRQCEANQSRIPDWERFHLDTLEGGGPIKPDSFYMEANAPSL